MTFSESQELIDYYISSKIFSPSTIQALGLRLWIVAKEDT